MSCPFDAAAVGSDQPRFRRYSVFFGDSFRNGTNFKALKQLPSDQQTERKLQMLYFTQTEQDCLSARVNTPFGESGTETAGV